MDTEISILGTFPCLDKNLTVPVGVYRNFTEKSQPAPVTIDCPYAQKDVHVELLRLDELKQKIRWKGLFRKPE